MLLLLPLERVILIWREIMALELYIETIKRLEEKNPGYLVEMDEQLGGIMGKCQCGSPMLCFSTRWRQGYAEYICPAHGLVIVDLEIK